jgi:hypothetical protein
MTKGKVLGTIRWIRNGRKIPENIQECKVRYQRLFDIVVLRCSIWNRGPTEKELKELLTLKLEEERLWHEFSKSL